MPERITNPKPCLTCPSCGERLHREGDLLRCEHHGLFFAYGPRLLVAVARHTNSSAPLLPWQTVQDRSHS